MKLQDEFRAIGPWIRDMRERRGWSLQDLADRSGLSKPYLAQLERGEANPTETTLRKVADAFGVSVVDLVNAALGRDNEEETPSFREFLDRYHPEPDLIPALRQLQFRGRPPGSADDWWRLYEVIRTLTAHPESAPSVE